MLTVAQASDERKQMKPERIAQIEQERMKVWIEEHIKTAQKEPSAELVTLTPVLAALLLNRNETNRPISQVNLDRLKRDIIQGRWEFNGEKIVVSKDGLLNDGQHRCRAVVETGIPIRLVIVFGPERDSRMTLDQGIVRTVGHYLGMSGFIDSNAIGSMAGYVWQYKTNKRISTAGSDRPTKTQVLDTVKHYVGIPDSLERVSAHKTLKIASRSLLAFVHFAIAERAGGTDADAFIEKLVKGVNLDPGSPILYCRNRLLEMIGKAHRPNDRVELIFRAWNAHRAGEVGTKEKPIRFLLGSGKLPKLEV